MPNDEDRINTWKWKTFTRQNLPHTYTRTKKSGTASYEMNTKHFDMMFLISLITAISLQVEILHDVSTLCLLSIYSAGSKKQKWP